MTSPPPVVPATTPLFQLPYLAEGQPMYGTRAVLQALVAKLEAVLQTKAVSPPGASDLLAVANRVAALESDQAAEDAQGAATAVTFGGQWEQFPTTAPYGELTRVWKDAQGRVRLQGLCRPQAGVTIAAGTRSFVLWVPVAFRPPVQLVRHLTFGGSTASAPFTLRADVYGTNAATPANAGGIEIQVPTGGSVAAANFCVLDLTWRLTNP